MSHSCHPLAVQLLLVVIRERMYCRPKKRSNQRGRRGTRRYQKWRGAHVPYYSAAPRQPPPHPHELEQGGSRCHIQPPQLLPRFAGLVEPEVEPLPPPTPKSSVGWTAGWVYSGHRWKCESCCTIRCVWRCSRMGAEGGGGQENDKGRLHTAAGRISRS
jgi:hypothetical protein